MAKPARNPAPDKIAQHAFDELPTLLAEAGITAATPDALAAMRAHFDLLLRWNQRMNLTSVRDPREILRRHFLESLYLTKVLALEPGMLYDIGSGAGFPGLPLKAAHPELKLVLVESSQKKAAFLKEVIRAAGMKNARVAAERAEALAEQPEVELADWITMRAVAPEEDFLRVLKKLLVPEGKLALFLGEEAASNLQETIQGFAWELPVPFPGAERRVILIGNNLF